MSLELTKSTSRRALGVIFLGVAVAHFEKRDFFGSLVPESLSEHEEAVDIGTEALMAVSGISFLVPSLRSVARRTTTAFLVPRFLPAIDQVRNPDRMRELGVPPAVAAAQRPRSGRHARLDLARHPPLAIPSPRSFSRPLDVLVHQRIRRGASGRLPSSLSWCDAPLCKIRP